MSDQSTPLASNNKKQKSGKDVPKDVPATAPSPEINSAFARKGAGLWSSLGPGNSESHQKSMTAATEVVTDDFFANLAAEDGESTESQAVTTPVKAGPQKVSKALDYRVVKSFDVYPLIGKDGNIFGALFTKFYDGSPVLKCVPKENITFVGRQAFYKPSGDVVTTYLSLSVNDGERDFTKFLPENSLFHKGWTLTSSYTALRTGDYWPHFMAYLGPFVKAFNAATPKSKNLTGDEFRTLPLHEKCFHDNAFNGRLRDPILPTQAEFMAVLKAVNAQEKLSLKRRSDVLSDCVSPMQAVDQNEVPAAIVL